MSAKSKIVFAVLLTFSLTSLMFMFFFRADSVISFRGSRLELAKNIIDNRYIGEYDRQKAEDAAIRAYIDAIGDRYSVYYDSDDAAAFMNSVQGSYVGVGIEVFANPETGEIVVLSAYSNSPAKRAGIKSGDVILAVDGTSYSSDTMNDAVAYMKGLNMEDPAGTEMVITVRRGGEEMELTVMREEVDLYSIESSVVGDSLLYIRYTGFSSESAWKLSKLLKNADETYKGIILDLRENPGGDLDAAVEVCDLFLEDGLIMYTEDRGGNRDEKYAIEGSCSLPLAVLVDGGSASASEIVAGCIQARGRGLIIGEKTYGKGVSQVIYNLGSDTSDGLIKITGYKNYRPDGIWLDEAVTPDIEVKTETSYDEYGNVVFDKNGDEPLKRAIEELSR